MKKIIPVILFLFMLGGVLISCSTAQALPDIRIDDFANAPTGAGMAEPEDGGEIVPNESGIEHTIPSNTPVSQP